MHCSATEIKAVVAYVHDLTRHDPQDVLADAAKAATSMPDREIMTRITGPEPAYKSSAVMLVQSALFLLSEGPRVRPGVHTPAAALGADAIVDRLSKHQIKFELLSDRQV